MDFDIAVLGLGAMGAATTAALARAGARVVAFDQHAPPHTLGSSHGHTRIIREAYYEHPLYVPLVRRAYELWSDLESESGTPLLRITGGLMVGAEDGPLVRGASASVRAHQIAHEMLDAVDIERRFPAFRPHRSWVGLHERRAGILFPERCVTAMLARARRGGAELRTGVRVQSWRSNGRGLRISTSEGTVSVARIVVAAGPWLPALRDSIGHDLPLEIERQLSHWFAPAAGDDTRYSGLPIALWETTKDGDLFATFPLDEHGIKCGMHHSGSPTDPDSVDRTVSPSEDEAARRQLDAVMPGAGGRRLESRVCLYTNTPDRHFLIDWLGDGRVLICSPCSGHGFKFAPAIGEIAAQLALGEKPWIDISPFSLSRFG